MRFDPFAGSAINLATDRISAEDACRQRRTAEEILLRLADRPGVVLADEVGMGKTFVALAVAVSTLLNRRQSCGPVVVMVPPSLREKWPRDWQVFREKCLAAALRDQFRVQTADSAIAFLRLLDDPEDHRAHLIFLAHGALHRALTDGFVRLAVIQRAFRRRKSLAAQRRNFGKFAGQLLRMDVAIERRAPGLLGELLELPTERWLRYIHHRHPVFRDRIIDDPVPQQLASALEGMRGESLEPLAGVLQGLPLRQSPYIDQRLQDVRRELAAVLPQIWGEALRRIDFNSPLLILDEAHHLRNPATRLASLFGTQEDTAESEQVGPSGALAGKFERMLFLTATPFQLGHAELVNVVRRFAGINWGSDQAPTLRREAFEPEMARLAESLDHAQIAALRLDRVWGKLTDEDIHDGNGTPVDVNTWWERVRSAPGDGIVAQVVEHVQSAQQSMREAEALLRPWVLRHLKPDSLPGCSDTPRRNVLTGAAICGGDAGQGLEIGGEVLLPFLLAGRAQMLLAASSPGRALFAEGLASSFEAYRETRSEVSLTEEDPDVSSHPEATDLDWYLEHLDNALPPSNRETWRTHPKVRATAEKAVELWRNGEKVLIFCHYRATGRALRQHISALLREEIVKLGRSQLPHLPPVGIAEELDRLGDRFFDTDGALRTQVTEELKRIVASFPELPLADQESVVEAVRRFLRTPSFLVRYFDLTQENPAAAFALALHREDVGGISLRARLTEFCRFLARRCVAVERLAYLEALDRLQTGSHAGQEVSASFDATEQVDTARRTELLPNVRLANGLVRDETRKRLLLAFNTPFFPEILIASSVLAEGVDLHLSCRHLIHHDLCWNPSVLEQRTGRVDRLGSKAELVKQPINVYLPYVAATQDEKQYRVVRDRERWFQIVLSEQYTVDEATTEGRSRRVRLPRALQTDLALRLQAEEFLPPAP